MITRTSEKRFHPNCSERPGPGVDPCPNLKIERLSSGGVCFRSCRYNGGVCNGTVEIVLSDYEAIHLVKQWTRYPTRNPRYDVILYEKGKRKRDGAAVWKKGSVIIGNLTMGELRAKGFDNFPTGGLNYTPVATDSRELAIQRGITRLEPIGAWFDNSERPKSEELLGV